MNFAHRITIERRPVFCPGIMNPALSSIARSFLMPADPYLWLEDVEGDEALAWVRARNAEKAQDLSQSDQFQETKARSEEHTSELQSRGQLVCRLLLETKKTT